MIINPADNTVLIKSAKLKDIIGGTFIDAVVTGKNQPEIGEVVAVGEFHPRFQDEPGHWACLLKSGNIIAYRRYGESKFFLKGEEYIFVSFDDILGVIELKENHESNNE